MKNILFGALVVLFALPGTVFAATGPAGTVTTLSATVIDGSAANLRASFFIPSADETVLFFEYGTTPSFGRRTYSHPAPKQTSKLMELMAYPLNTNVTYYYRAVIEGTSGATYGETRSFVSGGGAAESQGGATAIGQTGNTSTSGLDATTNNSVCNGVDGTNGTNGVSGANGAGGVSGSGGSGSTGQTGELFSFFGNSSGQNVNQTGAAANSSNGYGGGAGIGSGADGTLTQNQNPGGFFQRLFDSFTGARPVQLSVAMNPEKPSARDIVEYTITYANGSNQSVGGGNLSIILPDSVVYLADNSGGKTVLSKVSGGQRLTLLTDALSAKEKKTITVMAIAGTQVGKVPATAVASMAYTNGQGVAQNISTNKAMTATPLVAATGAIAPTVSSASNEPSSGGILPNTFFEWLIFLAVVTGIIVVVRRVLAIYQERKKRILEESREVVPAQA